MSMYRCMSTGGGGVTPTSITPSNASPVSLSTGNAYEVSESGYAIKSYNNVAPSNSTPVSLTAGEIDKMTGNGYAIQSYTQINNPIAPLALYNGYIYKCASNCYAISGYYDLYPSDATPTYLSQGVMYRARDTGVVVGDVHTATPSDSNPFYMYDDAWYKPTANGYLYETIQSGGSVSGYSLVDDEIASVATTHTLSNMSGKTLLVLIFSWQSSSNMSNTRYDGATVNGGTITKLTNLLSGNARVAGTFYVLDVTSDTCDITTSNSGYMKVFEATLS